jgi:hypothetical protein
MANRHYDYPVVDEAGRIFGFWLDSGRRLNSLGIGDLLTVVASGPFDPEPTDVLELPKVSDARYATPTVTFVLTERRKCRDGRDYSCVVLQVVEGGDLLDHVSAFQWLEMRFGESRPLCRAIA